MKEKWKLLLLPFIMFLTSCGGNNPNSVAQQMDYDTTKKMVVDILKTDEGKKAIQDVMSQDQMKAKLVIDQKVVTDTIQQTLTSDKAIEFWKKAFSDPKFAQTVATNMRSENENLLKSLINDPEYRNMMIEVFKEPAIQKELTDALKSKDYRSYLQQVITQTIDSPLYKAKIQDLLLKAAEQTKTKTGGTQGQGGAPSAGGT